MNKKVKSNYEQLGQYLGLRFDEEQEVLHRQKDGFELIVGPNEVNGKVYYMLNICLGADNQGKTLTKDEIKEFVKAHKTVSGLVNEGHTVTMVLKSYLNQKKLRANAQEAIQELTAFLRGKGYVPCCQYCGRETETEGYLVSGNHIGLCEECAASLAQNITLAQNQENEKKENMIGGIVGALVGSLLGVACIVILSQLGYVAALSGVVMAVCTLKGYEIGSGKLSKRGIVISVILMLVMTYVGDRLDWAIMIARELEVDIATGYRYFPLLLSEDIIDFGSYAANLVLVYAFLLLGAIPTIRNANKGKKVQRTFGKLR